MMDHAVSTQANSQANNLGNKLIIILAMLSGLGMIYPMVIPITMVIFGPAKGGALLPYLPWIGKMIFSGAVYVMMRRTSVAIPVSILAFMQPIVGGVFFLLSTTILQAYERKNE
jgi:hypothetical protein